jgi:hypothetical protein
MLLTQPVIVNDRHFDDTILLANIGWRGVNGSFPNIDYPHFYGGLDAHFVILAFRIFGVDFISINYAFGMMFVWATANMVILTLGRLSLYGIATLVALSAGLILSLAPIETGLISGQHSAHSFVYNHLAIVLMIGLSAYASSSLESKRQEIASSIFAGFTGYMLVLLKTTFAIFLPFIVVALICQRRWISTAFFMLGWLLALMTLDPWATRVTQSLEVLLAADAAQANATFEATMRRLTTNVSAQFVVILLLSAVLFDIWVRDKHRAVRIGVTLWLCALGYLGSLISMGGTGGYMLLPILVAASVVLTDASSEAHRSESDSAPWQAGHALFFTVPSVVSYSFIFPALVSAVVTFADTWRYRHASLILSGPAASYVVKGSGITPVPDIARSVSVARTSIENDISTTWLPFDDSIEYVMYADGVALLSSIPAIEEYGVVADGRMFDFSAAIRSRPVLSFPVWPTQDITYFQSTAPLDADIDLVMLSSGAPSLELVGSSLRRRMNDDFVACRKSALWTLYSRNDPNLLEGLSCDRAP